MTQIFQMYVTYSQIAIFDPSLQNPFNDWTFEHFNQGFSWRQESVSFRTIDESAMYTIEIELLQKLKIHSNTIRAISVPFTVHSSDQVEIASISDGKLLRIPNDQYMVVFQDASRRGIHYCYISFIPYTLSKAAILRADDELSPKYPLLLDTSPATAQEW